MKRIVIIGAGLVGTFLGIGLARRGHQVRIFERRPDPRRLPPRSDRSLMIVLSRRGFRALESLELADTVGARCTPIRGRMIHGDDGRATYQPYGQRGEAQQAISRAEINRLLLDLAEREPGLRIEFGKKCVDADLEVPSLRLEDVESGAVSDVDADHVFGTDGAFSAIRQRLGHKRRFQYSQDYLSHVYREIVIPPAGDGGWLLENDCFHVWPRRELMLAGFPNSDGSFGLSLFLPFEGPRSNQTITTLDELDAVVAECFPDIHGHVQDELWRYFAQPVGHLTTIKCFPWVLRDKVALVGDACHAILPFYGQGVNAGFEDCQVLLAELDQHRDWATAFDAYQRARKPEADAIADISLHHFEVLQDRVGRDDYLRRLEIERKLEQRFPSLESPSLYGNITFRGLPYTEALAIDARYQAVLDRLLVLEAQEDVTHAEHERRVREVLAELEDRDGDGFLEGAS